MTRKRAFVIGIDGGSWNIIGPLIASGRLPHLKEVMGAGAWGTLKSTCPPVTCPAWFTFSTSLKPSKLGIYEFRGMPGGTNEIRYHTYKELHHTEFWDILMREKKSCGIVNDPLVFPLKQHLGYIVPGFITPLKEFKTYPEQLMTELNEVTGGYEIDQQGGFVIDDDTLLDGCLRVIKKRVEAISYLLRNYSTDFLLAVFTSTDRICHRYLNRAVLGDDEDSRAGWEAISAIYEEVDKGVGLILSMMGAEDCLMLMSDHGFTARPWNIHVNQFLAEQSLLNIEMRGTLDRLGITQRNMGKILLRLGLAEKALRITPNRLRNLVPVGESIYGEFFIHELIEQGKLDWSKTRALCLGSEIYLNTKDRPYGVVSLKEADKIKATIIEGLLELRDPGGGENGIKAVEPREIYGGDHLVDPPDLMLVGEGEWEIASTLARTGEIFTANRRAGHSPEGIFMLCHPDIKQGEVDAQLGIEDLGPTILHIFDIPVPENMDGYARNDLFRAGTPLAKEARRTIDKPHGADAEKERVKRRIARMKENDSL